MMAAVFASLTLALILGCLGRTREALGAIAVCLGLAIWLFLFEIYSPEYGFRMPWISTEAPVIGPAGDGRGVA
ncbi:MAG: hypothetical protein B7Y80_00420 [Hyphomicrobium sp. 32-62-53]|nr:MAG: hypothetical protein B7Z29_13740 [Hyphomicrobium sp. 12-62-95]OYY01820.1 MAG: hypothetical protein B7Y80_00420 [Hyphomicrobium sp. 32-62-53]